MQVALVLIFLLLSGCSQSRPDRAIYSESGPDQVIDRADSYWTEERKALYERAREGARQARERYIATSRPALQQQFRQEYPSLTDAEIDALVDDALENGLRQAVGRRRLDPARPPIDCMSPQLGRSVFTNCY